MVQGRMENRKLILNLSGEIDSSNAEQIEKQILGIRGGGPCDTVELNCDQLQFVSSAGLRVILTAHKTMSSRNGMKVTHVNEIVQEVFDVTGFADILTIEA